MRHLLEPIAEAIHGGRDAQRAPFVALEALPAASRAPACAWQGARLVGLQSIANKCIAQRRVALGMSGVGLQKTQGRRCRWNVLIASSLRQAHTETVREHDKSPLHAALPVNQQIWTSSAALLKCPSGVPTNWTVP